MIIYVEHTTRVDENTFRLRVTLTTTLGEERTGYVTIAKYCAPRIEGDLTLADAATWYDIAIICMEEVLDVYL